MSDPPLRMTPASTTIIIVAYNGKEFLETCLQSVVREAEPNCEILVVDNASTDGCADSVEREYPCIRLIRNQENRGFVVACNQGASAAKGRYLVFLNQDTEVLSGWLSELITPLERNPSVGLTTSKALLLSDPSRINSCGLDVHFAGLSSARGFGCDSACYAEVENVAAVCGASFAVRNEVWQQLGGFDGDFFMYFEETDLSWRAQLLGYDSLYVPASVLLHAHSPGIRPSSYFYSERNRGTMLARNWKFATLLILSGGLLLAELASLAYTFSGGREAVLAKARAYAALVLALPEILSARRTVQASRIVQDHRILALRSDRIRAQEVTGGKVGRFALGCLNVGLQANFWAAQKIMRFLDL